MIDSMKNAFKVCQIFLIMCGVFGAETDEVKTVSVMEGDSVTLNPDLSKISGIIQMKWRFGDSRPVIAQFDMNEISYPSVPAMFEDRLKMNPTGSLTITNMRTKHAGLYKLEIDHDTGTSYENFRVNVYESPAVIGAFKGELKSVSVTEGDSDTLQTDTETHGDELIVWRFGDEEKLIAKHDIEAKSSPSYDTDERFRDRLKLNNQTGSLTITNFRFSDSGLYTVKISSSRKTLNKRFSVSVSPVPVSVPVSGLSGGAVAAIVVLLLLVFSAVAAAGVFYYRRKLSELQNQKRRPMNKSVLKGSPVTLKCVTEIKKDDKIQWMFGAEQKLIAEMTGENRRNPKWFADEFRGQMKLDPQTGSLTIHQTRPEHSGLYKIVINSSDSTFKLFSLFVFDEQKSVSVMEEADVILRVNTGEQTGDHKIFWMFEDDNCLIAKNTEDECEEESKNSDFRFTDKVVLNCQTGDLTIKNIRTFQTGKYKLKIIRNGKTSFKLFNVTVYACKVKKSVLKGRSVTLKCDTEIQKDDKIQWMFETKQKLIAEMTGENRKNPKCFADEFKHRMKLNPQTGSLTIQHTKPEHSGLYKMVINSSDYSTSTLFTLIVFDEQKSVSVMEGADVTLHANTGELTRDHKIFWMFGDDNHLIDKNTEDECEEESKNRDFRFADKVVLNRQTGDLTIKNITTSHTGKYKLKIIRNGKTSFKLFNVTVYGHPVKRSVLKGDSVTLKCGTEIQKDDKIQWMFGAEQKLIAEMTGENRGNPKWFADEFRNQMKLDPQTGSLIIEHTRPEHSGLYKIEINRSYYSTFKLFTLIVFDEQKSVSVTEGADVTLRADTGELTGNHKIFWMFGNDNIIMAKYPENECEESKNREFTCKDDVDLNPHTGDLTIKKIKTSHVGQYKLKIIRNGKTSFKLFRVNFSAVPSEEETKSLKDFTENRENDSVTVLMPLLDGANERETTSSV